MNEPATPATASARFRRRLYWGSALLVFLAVVGTYFGAKRLRDVELDVMDDVLAAGGESYFVVRRTAGDWLPASFASYSDPYIDDRKTYEEKLGPDWLSFSDRLERIHLDHVYLRKVDLERLAGRPRLRDLYWIGPLSAADVERLAQCRRIEEISIGSSEPIEVDLRPLSRLPRLRCFRHLVPQLVDSKLAFLAEFESLESLELTHNERVDGRFLESKAQWPALAELRMWYTGLDSEGIVRIAARCPNLRVLEADYFDLEPCVDAIVGMARLERAAFHKVHCNVASLRRLAQSKSLVEVDLNDSNVDVEGFFELTALPKLKTVSIRGTRLPQAAAEEFRRRRPGVTVLGPRPAYRGI